MHGEAWWERHERTGEPEPRCSILPLLGVMAAGAALGGLSGAATKRSEVQAPKLDQGAYRYSGVGQDTYRRQGAEAQARQGVAVDYAQAGADRGMQLAARSNSADAMGMYQQAALGQGPSAAQAQVRAGIDANMAASLAAAASARGTGVQRAAAQMSGIQAASGANQAVAAQAAMLRAQEQQAAMAGYAQAAQAMRAQDLQSQGLSAQQAQYVAMLEDQQRARNDQMQLAYEQLGQRSADTAYAGGMRYQEAQAGMNNQANMYNAQVGDANRSALVRGIVGGAMGGLQTGMSMGLAKSGDAGEKKPWDPGF